MLSINKQRKAAYNSYSRETSQSPQGVLDFKIGVRNEDSKVHSSHFVLALELTILTLVRSFREANFCLYREKLAELLPYFFANNNVNYAWWL